MRVILTGGTGLIGSALVENLHEAGYEVIILSRNPARHSAVPGVKLIKWDGLTSQGWGEWVDSHTAILNRAGDNLSSGRWTAGKKRLIGESRVNAGKAVVQAVQHAAQKPAVVIQSSAVGVYGPRLTDPVTEATSLGTDFLANVCKEWESSTAAVEEMGVRRVITRTGVAISIKGGAFPPLMLPYRLLVGGPVGSGDQYFPWIHMADEVAATRFLIEHPETTGAYNLCAPNPLTNREFGKVLGRVLGRPSWIPVPAFALRLLFGEMSTILLDGQREVPERLLAAGFRFRFPEAEAALRDLLKKD